MKKKESIYRVIFTQDAKTYEIYAKYISEEAMMGFVEVEQLIFTEDHLLVDPSEEKLKEEFRDVERIYIPMHSIFRIDQVVKEGHARIQNFQKNEGNVWHFPTSTRETSDDLS